MTGWRCHICGATGTGSTPQWQRHYNLEHLTSPVDNPKRRACG